MHSTPKNTIEFRVWGRYAMFTDSLTRVGGEKCSYHLPTYEALKGIAKSIYWKPTFIWYIDQVRVMKRIRTQTKGMKPMDYVSGGNTLAIYTFLTGDPDPETKEPGVEYQVRAHFEWNEHRPELKKDRIEGKHFEIAKRSLERGGRQDIFLGTRDCQGYVEPCDFASGEGAQLSHLVDLYQKLPRHLPDDSQAMRDALALLRSFDLRELTYPLPGAATAAGDSEGLSRLERFLRDLERLLPSWSNNLSSRHFSHARTLPIAIGQ